MFLDIFFYLIYKTRAKQCLRSEFSYFILGFIGDSIHCYSKRKSIIILINIQQISIKI
jgi:hypothetical protein